MAGPLKVEVVPWGVPARDARGLTAAALEHPTVKSELGDGDARLLSVAPVQPDDGVSEPTTVRATLYDYTARRTLLIDVPVFGGAPVVASSARQPLPTDEEREAALDVLRADAGLGRELAEGRLQSFRPMPPLVLEELPDGAVERTVAIGLRPSASDTPDEIVGVRLATKEVVRFDDGVPATAGALRRGGGRCGLPNANQPTVMGEPGAARVTVSRNGEILWRFVAVRPAASVGTNGSAVELRNVSFRGRRVLRRAHVPILNVRYDDDACGPYRDWQNQEGMLRADGDDVAPGFRLCPTPATTVLESGRDRGNFAGVAIFVDGDEVVLVSELEAGWYRYISAWRLDADGTIRPRFGFGAVENACVCTRHHHHAYWRLDFDIAGAADDRVEEFNDPVLPGRQDNWHTLRHEVRRRRNAAHGRRWRVRNRGSGEGYVLTPGPHDGEADAFGVGDLWALRRRPGQIDDGVDFTMDPEEARAHLGRFVNGESIVGQDVVLWYAAHFSHDVGRGHDDASGHIVGPTLSPHRW